MQVRILYATITGNNQAVARVIEQAFQAHAWQTQVEQIEFVEPAMIDPAVTDVLVIVPYTFDLGSLPEEGLDFYDALPDYRWPGLTVGVAGSGDDFYGEDYGVAVPKFETQLALTQATLGAPGVKVNLYPDATAVVELETFVTQLIATAQKNKV